MVHGNSFPKEGKMANVSFKYKDYHDGMQVWISNPYVDLWLFQIDAIDILACPQKIFKPELSLPKKEQLLFHMHKGGRVPSLDGYWRIIPKDKITIKK